MSTALKIEPDSKVTFRLERDRIVIKPFFDAVAVFRRVAKSGKSISALDPHAAYEEELEERYQRAIVGTKENKEKAN